MAPRRLERGQSAGAHPGGRPGGVCARDCQRGSGADCRSPCGAGGLYAADRGFYHAVPDRSHRRLGAQSADTDPVGGQFADVLLLRNRIRLGSIDTDALLKGAAGIGLLSGIMVALGALAGLIPSAMVGVLGLGVVMAELAVVLAAIGAWRRFPASTG